MENPIQLQYITLYIYMVGGAITILKNDVVRQWEEWHPIYEMENSQFIFETTNQISSKYIT